MTHSAIVCGPCECCLFTAALLGRLSASALEQFRSTQRPAGSGRILTVKGGQARINHTTRKRFLKHRHAEKPGREGRLHDGGPDRSLDVGRTAPGKTKPREKDQKPY